MISVFTYIYIIENTYVTVQNKKQLVTCQSIYIREREREGGRERERQTDRQRQRQTDRQTEELYRGERGKLSG